MNKLDMPTRFTSQFSKLSSLRYNMVRSSPLSSTSLVVLVLAMAFVSPGEAYVPASVEKQTLDTTGLKLTWERSAESQIRKKLSQRREEQRPFLVSVSGIPGSGKSTCAGILRHFLSDTGAMVFPHDGYHYPVSTLKKLPDADAAIYRRGAPDTFDAKALVKDLHRIRQGKEHSISLPGFDHAVGDPEEGAHQFRRPEHNVVICEGLYLLHDEDGWDPVSSLFDLNIFVDANVDKCMDRLKIRNECIPGYTKEEIHVRVDAIDRKNAMTVQKSKDRANLIYRSAAF